MTLHDLYLLSPELSVAGAAILLILVDLVVRRSGLAAALAIAGLALALGLSIALWLDLNGDGVQATSGVFGTLVVDKFSLFFKFLFVGVAAMVVLDSIVYVRRFDIF